MKAYTTLNLQEYFYCKVKLHAIIANAQKKVLTISNDMSALLFSCARPILVHILTFRYENSCGFKVQEQSIQCSFNLKS